MKTPDKNEFYALRWRAVADALGLDPSCDPGITGLRVRMNACAELREVSDLLAERMALLDRERPGVTLIECVQGLLDATAQKPAASPTMHRPAVDLDAVLDRFKGAKAVVLINNFDAASTPYYHRGVLHVRSTPGAGLGRRSIPQHYEERADVLLELLEDGSIEVHKDRDGATGRILSPLAAMRERAEKAERELDEVRTYADGLKRALRAEQVHVDKAVAAIDRLITWSGAPECYLLKTMRGSDLPTQAWANCASAIIAAVQRGRDGYAKLRDDGFDAMQLRAERAEAALAAADIEGIRARSNARADALRTLGWSGEGDPKAWADQQVAFPADPNGTPMLPALDRILTGAGIGREHGEIRARVAKLAEQQSGCDVHAKLATATRDAKTRGDALALLGWNGSEHPEAWAPRLRESCRLGREMLDKAEKDLATLTAAHDKAMIHAKRWEQACKATGHDPDGEGLIANAKKAMEALVEPLRAATGYAGTLPARVVQEAVKRLYDLAGERNGLDERLAAIDEAIGLTSGVERMDRLASLVHDAATCEQHRRLVDAIDEAMAPAFVGAACIPGPVLDRAQELVRRVMSADKAPPLSEAIVAAHRWRAADLQALLDHERHMRAEADKDLVELTRPIWVLMPGGAPRDIAPRGIIRQMVEMLASCAKLTLPSAAETE